MTKKKVGLLGGSFDPIHFGHLNLAICLSEACSLEEVFFCPTALSPFKTTDPSPIAIHHRLEMVRLAIRGISSFRLFDGEACGTGPFYTIDTVRRLTQDASIELHLLMAEDHAARLGEWKDAKELFCLAPPLIGSRHLSGSISSDQTVKIPLFDISSTEIRARLSQKKYCGHLIPSLVLDYIEQHRLYS